MLKSVLIADILCVPFMLLGVLLYHIKQWNLDRMADILPTTFSNVFLVDICYILIHISQRFVSDSVSIRNPLTLGHAKACHRSRDDPLIWCIYEQPGFMMTSSNGNIFLRYWPFVRGIHRSPVNSLTKASDAELWCFLWSAPE